MAEATIPERDALQTIDISIFKRVFESRGDNGIPDKDTFQQFKGKDGKDYASITLPYGFPELTDTEGNSHDKLGGFRFVVPAWRVKDYPNDPNYHHVSIPLATGDGRPWTVQLSKQTGERDENGKWQVVSEEKFSVESSLLAEAAQDYRTARQNSYKERMEELQKSAPIEEIEEVAVSEKETEKASDPASRDEKTSPDLKSLASDARAAAEVSKSVRSMDKEQSR